MRAAILIIGVFIIAATLAWEFVPLRVIIWDGAFDLRINVSSTGEPLNSVRCKGCGSREEAEWLLDNPSHLEGQCYTVVADPFDGKAISVSVPMSRISPMGRELRQRQLYKYIVVIGRLQNGTQITKLVDVPDSRELREMSVSLP